MDRYNAREEDKVSKDTDKEVKMEGFCIICRIPIPLYTYNGLCPQCWLNQVDEEVYGIKRSGIKGNYCHRCGEKYPTTSEKLFCEKCESEFESLLKFLLQRIQKDKKDIHYIQIISKTSEEEVMEILRKSGLAREDIRKRIMKTVDDWVLNEEISVLEVVNFIGIQENLFNLDIFPVSIK